jgi:methylmalonyl-CoA/ethylmalonyl-CoA epimerase
MIEGIDHIGIAVRSIAEARGTWERLGLRVAEIEEVPSEQVRVAMIPCGDTRIELLEPTSPDSPIARFLERRGPGIHHLCLRSGDVLAADRELRDAGVELVRDAPGPGAGGALVQFVHPRSGGGVLLELSQPAAGGEGGGGHHGSG